MKLRGIDFGQVLNASGARGFRGEGYWFHPFWRPFGLGYKGATLVSKTTTLLPRAGNMPLDGLMPKKAFPDCILVKPNAGIVLNAVGLSGPGVAALVSSWRHELPSDPFVVSIMSVAPSAEERLSELQALVAVLELLVETHGREHIAIQVNLSCPNAGLDTSHLAREAEDVLDIVQRLGVVTMVKLNALVAPETALRMSMHPACDAVVMGNTIPWGQLADRIDWEGIFGRTTSPLAKYGGGGLSGAPLLPIVCDWIRAARKAGLYKPIVGGGGILSKADADLVFGAGADAVELGSVSILRPWRVQGIIRHARTWGH